ncbi:MAG TPA: family 78 glycoside hydrolase catalytic domain [Candidatus Gallacutalibacter stercoravium]|nr:family 78 glycoside hydrolase catalytic domain [Candidatus Gallacutalibacter stercoravium]
MPINNLRCCGSVYPRVVGEHPVFTFQAHDFIPKTMQVSVFHEQELSTPLWQSEVLSADTFSITCNATLQERSRYAWRVRATDKAGRCETSGLAYFETGFFGDAMPGAQWVGSGQESSAPILFDRFSYSGQEPCRLYCSALGYAHWYVNGRLVSCDELSPVWSDYHARNLSNLLYPIHDKFHYSHYYQCYDITSLLSPGENTIAVWLGNGFYHQTARTAEGNMDYGLPKAKWSVYLAEEAVCLSGDSSRWAESPVVFNNVYLGEHWDGRIPSAPALQGQTKGSPCVVYPPVESVARGQLCPPDRVTSVIAPRLVGRYQNTQIYDMGENSSGRARIVTSVPSGERIRLTYCEELKNGAPDYTSAGGEGQIQCDEYISNGSNGQEFAPLFCIHGFRYVTVEGEIDSIVCEIVHADVKQIGRFETSSSVLNGVTQAYLRSQASNLHGGVPSDCPHRERLGYTGDGQLTASTACLFFDMQAFYRKWLRDIADCQCAVSGHVQHTAPFYGGGGGPGGWGGAMVFLPWTLYLHSGDLSVLSDYYPHMTAWMKYLQAHCSNHILCSEEPGGWCLGDWCVPGKIEISEAYVNTCLYIQQLEIMQKVSLLCKDVQQADVYQRQRAACQAALRQEFCHDGVWDKGVQGAEAFAWKAGLLTRQEAQQLLAKYRSQPVDTGIFGTPLLIESLCEVGLEDVAVSLLTQTDYPSLGYMLEQGATTLWETFEGEQSHNHPMFGAVIGVLLRCLTGITPDESAPGYRRVLLQPHFSSLLEHACATVHTPYGPLSAGWKRLPDGNVEIIAALPCGMEGEVLLNGRRVPLTAGVQNKICCSAGSAGQAQG